MHKVDRPKTQFLENCRLNLFITFILLLLVSLAIKAEAGIPQVSEIMISDVTTRSFSVIWISNEPSTASLNVFNADCQTSTIGAVIDPHPVQTGNAAIVNAAKNNGIAKVEVTGLEAATNYCFQTVTTSISTTEETITPATPIIVTTETQTTMTHTIGPDILPFTNDVIYSPDPVSSVEGGILAVELIDLGGYPVTGFVGDGIDAPYSIVDLKNIFHKTDRDNINLLGEERIKLSEYRGTNGCTLVKYRKIPLDMEKSELVQPASCFDTADLDCNNTINILDILRDVEGYETTSSGTCFNSDFDMDGNGQINNADITYMISKFGATK